MRADGEQREGYGQHERDDAQNQVHLAPSGQIGAQKRLPQQVQHRAARTGHSVGQADDQAQLLFEPAVQQTCHHQPQKRDLAEAYQDARQVPLPQLGVKRHGGKTQAGGARRRRAHDTHVETLQQAAHRRGKHHFGQIDDSHVHGYVEHLDAQVLRHGAIAQPRHAERHRRASERAEHAGGKHSPVPWRHLLSTNCIHGNPVPLSIGAGRSPASPHTVNSPQSRPSASAG